MLARYMDDHWRDTLEVRGIETWDSISYPPNAPLTSRPDWRKAGADAEPAKLSEATLDRFGFAHALLASGPAARRDPGMVHHLGIAAHEGVPPGEVAALGQAPVGAGLRQPPDLAQVAGGDDHAVWHARMPGWVFAAAA